MLHFLTIGTLLGLSAGFAPDPLLTLVISETLRRDVWAGGKVALAPVLTDLPIIVLALLLLAKLSNFEHILGTVTLPGVIWRPCAPPVPGAPERIKLSGGLEVRQ